MSSSSTPVAQLLMLCRGALMLVIVCVGRVPGQDKIPDVLNRPPADAVDDAPKEQLDGVMQFEMDPQRWTEMAFGNLGGSQANFEQSLKRRVRKVLNRIELLCGLPESLREKVTATADLEYQRLEAEITAMVIDAPRHPTQQQYQDFYQKLWAIVEPYRNANLVQAGDISKPQNLWQKVLYSHLNEDEKEIVKSDERKRLEQRNEVQRLETLMKLSRVLGLDSQQIQEFEGVASANPQGWISLDMAWAQLQAMPPNILKDYLTEAQQNRLKQPLEVTNDIQPVMIWEMPE